MRIPGRWTAIFLAALCWTGDAAARVGVRLNTYLSYTDNLFQNYSRRPDWVALTYFDLDYARGAGFNLYYTGNASVFAEYRDLFSHNHQVGVGYVRQGKGRNALYSGVEASLRLDRPIYRYYDYLQGEAYLNAKVYLQPRTLSRFGYQVRYREYMHAGDYSFVEQTASAQVNRFLKTRTTLRVQADLGVKAYAREFSADSTEAVARTRAGGARTLAQATVRFKVAQTVMDGTGAHAEYLRLINFLGRDRYAEVEGYNTDDELFDDRYAYRGDEVRAGVKHVAPWGLQVEAAGRYVRRHYEGRPALDLDGFLIGPDLMRQDTRKSLGLEVEQAFRLSGGWLREVGLRVEWLYLDINSNDPYYQTTAQIYSIGLQVGF